MRILTLAALYTALALGANGAVADTAALEALKDGDMAKLMLSSTPAPATLTPFLDEQGQEMTLESKRGKVVLVNFWATWCAPCREEMPALSALQTELGGDDFEVVTIATGRNAPSAVTRFMEEIGVTNLPLCTDPRQAFARDMGVMGLPVTVILDREGNEVGRLMGGADWSSDSAKAILQAVIAGG